MNDEEIQRIQDELLKDIDKEQKIETEIVSSSEEITSHLIISKKCTAEINGKPYLINYRLLENAKHKVLYLLIADINKYRITGNKYIPFSASADMDERYSERDNLKTVVEAFIRHVTGKIKPDTLEE